MLDDRINCEMCINLTKDGHCKQAKRGNMPDTMKYWNPNPILERRCYHYDPVAGLTDQRKGSELWPTLSPTEQEIIKQGKKKNETRTRV